MADGQVDDGDANDDGVTPTESAADAPKAKTKEPKAWKKWVRWGAIVLVIIVLAVELTIIWPDLEKAWDRIGDIQWGWLVAALAVAILEMECYAQVQRVLFRSAGVHVKESESLGLILAQNSISQTMPGGQVLAPAFVYRESRKWGASPVVASWQLVMSGLLAAVGLAVLGLGGTLLAGAKSNPFSIFFSIAGFVVFVAVVQFLASHPEILESLGLRFLHWFNDLRGKPSEIGVDRWKRIVGQFRAVKLRRRDTLLAFFWSLVNWISDVACLALACYAVGGRPSFSGLMLAYAASKAVGTVIPIIPGGLGVVDAMLVPALISAGMPGSDAVLAVVVYRIISYLIISLIGWVIIALRYRDLFTERNQVVDEMEREEGTEDREIAAEAAASSDTPPDKT